MAASLSLSPAPSSSTTSRSASPGGKRWTRARWAPRRWVATATSSCTEGTRPSAARTADTSRCSSTPSTPGSRSRGVGTEGPGRCQRRAEQTGFIEA
uniref:Uncharacterized protein n=1 Tax=Arundo donax TaxID=35708 RepID=A0A0A9DKM4_ARUDO